MKVSKMKEEYQQSSVKKRCAAQLLAVLLMVSIVMPLAPAMPVVTAVAAETQRDKVESFVERLYSILLGREVDAEGLKYWTDTLISGADTGANVAAGIVFSEELVSRNLSNEEFIHCIPHHTNTG